MMMPFVKFRILTDDKVEDIKRSSFEVMAKVGPGGNFLVEDHTLKFFRNEIWAPKLMTRKSYDMWKSEGSKDTTRRIQEKIQIIMEKHKVPPLSDKTISALEKIRQKGEMKRA